ncbi:YuiA family protein [Paenisporosarcina sp. TG20]|nr:YuiA family protein [Paenisporosarcina sp. TG20]
MTIHKKNEQANQCPYCKGNGYFQLRLGGSETCACCDGSGKK